jgi:opacity protein-like surface antigen
MNMRYLIGLLLMCGWISASQAQEIRGGYVGVSAGVFSFRDDDGELGLRFSDTTGAYRLIGGYHFNSNYALEAGLARTGDLSEGFSFVDPNFGNVAFKLAADYEIRTLRLLVLAPFGNVSMFGGGGYYDSKLNATFSLSSASESLSERDSLSDDGFTVVGGVQFDLDRISIRGEYEWFNTSGGIEMSNFAAVVLFRF